MKSTDGWKEYAACPEEGSYREVTPAFKYRSSDLI